MDPSFFLTFWTLTMSDLEVPHHMYEKEIKKIDANVSVSSMIFEDLEIGVSANYLILGAY